MATISVANKCPGSLNKRPRTNDVTGSRMTNVLVKYHRMSSSECDRSGARVHTPHFIELTWRGAPEEANEPINSPHQLVWNNPVVFRIVFGCAKSRGILEQTNLLWTRRPRTTVNQSINTHNCIVAVSRCSRGHGNDSPCQATVCFHTYRVFQ